MKNEWTKKCTDEKIQYEKMRDEKLRTKKCPTKICQTKISPNTHGNRDFKDAGKKTGEFRAYIASPISAYTALFRATGLRGKD